VDMYARKYPERCKKLAPGVARMYGMDPTARIELYRSDARKVLSTPLSRDQGLQCVKRITELLTFARVAEIPTL